MTKPGESMTQRLAEREKKAKAVLARIEQQKKQARDRVTGKTKAQAYVRLWLERLTATELRHECAIRGFLYGEFETMEQAMDAVQAALFSGVVVNQHSTEGQLLVEREHMRGAVRETDGMLDWDDLGRSQESVLRPQEEDHA